MRIKYVGPFDEIELPDVGAVVRSGAVLDVGDDVGAGLLVQPTNFVPVDAVAAAFTAAFTDEERHAYTGQDYTPPGEVVGGPGADVNDLPAWTVAQLRDLAATEGIDLGGATKKADLIDAITAHNNDDEES